MAWSADTIGTYQVLNGIRYDTATYTEADANDFDKNFNFNSSALTQANAIEIISIRFELALTAAVATRTPYFQLRDDNDDVVYEQVSEIDFTANDTSNHHFSVMGRKIGQKTGGNETSTDGMPAGLMIAPDMDLRFALAGGQAGDDMTIRMMVRLYRNP